MRSAEQTSQRPLCGRRPRAEGITATFCS